MVWDPRAQTYTAVLAVEGSTFALLESSMRGSRVEAWGSLLAQLCSENAVIARLQVLERTVPDSGDRLRRDWQRRGIHDGSLQAANYEQLLAAVDGSTMAHECFVAVAVDARRAGSEIRQAGGGHSGAAAVLVREVDKIADGLQAAGVRVQGWCPPRLLGEIIRTAYDPAARQLIHRRGGSPSDPGRRRPGPAVRGRPGRQWADPGRELLVALPHRQCRAPLLVGAAMAPPVRRCRVPVTAAAGCVAPADRVDRARTADTDQGEPAGQPAPVRRHLRVRVAAPVPAPHHPPAARGGQ